MIRRWGVDAEPSAQGRIKGAKPVAVLDIGSNSVRLVVYERHARALTPLYNEKASCALGRGVAATGRLADENVARAISAVRRYALVVRLMGVAKVYILATSAVRDAANGPEFSAQVSEIMQEPVNTLTGSEEAHFAALGVVAGIPKFTGFVGDMGGGSLEISDVTNGEDISGETLALGVIRVQDDCEGSIAKASKLVAERLKQSGLQKRGGTFCAIGGTWRSLAKLHQFLEDYPLHMVQHYEVSAASVLKLCKKIIDSYAKDETYPLSERMSSSRRALVPFGAVVMSETLKAGGFDNVVFSALGVREGYLFDQLPSKQKTIDPLIQVCEEMSILRSRSPAHAHDLIEFTNSFISGSGLEESPEDTRLRKAACFLSDIGWRGHPDYRGEQSVDMVAYGALVGIDHPGRAFLSEALAVRYMGLKHKSVSSALMQLAGDTANARARVLGALMRVAYPMSAGMSGILPHAAFHRDGNTLILQLPKDFAFLDGERLNNRLSQLANAAGFETCEVRTV